jgi:TonB family protein
MVFMSEAREIRSHFGSDIEQVQRILRANHVDFGTPYDLPAFAQALESNSQLREELTDLAQALTKREKNVSLPTVLNIIAIAAGGPQIAASEEDISQPLSRLDDFLINIGNEDQSKSGNPEQLSSSFPGDDSHPYENHHAIHLASHPSDQQVREEEFSGNEELNTLEPLDHNPSPVGNVFAESLTRLELNSLQMKHYLDSIDQRISRMEPRLESHPAYVAPPSHHPLKHAPEERYSAAIATESLPNPPQEELLLPQQPFEQLNESHELHRLSNSLSDPVEESQPKTFSPLFTIPAVSVLAAGALTLLLYWSTTGNTSSITTHPLTATAVEEPNSSAGLAPASPAPPSERSANTTGLLRKNDAEKPSPKINQPTSTATHNASPTDTTSHAPAATLDENAIADPTVISATASAVPDRTNYSSFSSRPINVSSGVMAANVISAPNPAYPRLARLAHMQGEVVMQAIVSREGTIENVRVIKGHRLLRGAATNAVRTWRYRPFEIAGQPVKVATIISVDFKLKP